MFEHKKVFTETETEKTPKRDLPKRDLLPQDLVSIIRSLDNNLSDYYNQVEEFSRILSFLDGNIIPEVEIKKKMEMHYCLLGKLQEIDMRLNSLNSLNLNNLKRLVDITGCNE
jgi:hypothetical protein